MYIHSAHLALKGVPISYFGVYICTILSISMPPTSGGHNQNRIVQVTMHFPIVMILKKLPRPQRCSRSHTIHQYSQVRMRDPFED